MARGKALSVQIRRFICANLQRGVSPDRLYQDLNDGDNKGLISLRSLKNLRSFLRTRSPQVVKGYTSGIGKKTGRKKKLTRLEINALDDLNTEDNSASLETLCANFHDIYGKKISPSTAHRTLKLLGVTNKIVTEVPGQADVYQQIEHLRLLRTVPYQQMIDIDETHDGGGSKAAAKRGRSRGRATRREFVIDGKRRTFMAAVTPNGFLLHVIFDDNCSAEHFIHLSKTILVNTMTKVSGLSMTMLVLT